MGDRVSAPWHERWGRATRARGESAVRRFARKCDRGPRIRGRFARFVFGGLASTRITSIRVTGSASEIARLVPVNIRAVVVSKTHRRRWWWHPRCWRSHRRRRRRASRPRQHRQPAEREKWRRRARVSGRLPEESPGKRCHEIPIIPKGFNPRNALESASAPRRAARPDPTRAWIQIIWSVDNVNRAFVAPRRAGSGTNSR